MKLNKRAFLQRTMALAAVPLIPAISFANTKLDKTNSVQESTDIISDWIENNVALNDGTIGYRLNTFQRNELYMIEKWQDDSEYFRRNLFAPHRSGKTQLLMGYAFYQLAHKENYNILYRVSNVRHHFTHRFILRKLLPLKNSYSIGGSYFAREGGRIINDLKTKSNIRFADKRISLGERYDLIIYDDWIPDRSRNYGPPYFGKITPNVIQYHENQIIVSDTLANAPGINKVVLSSPYES